MGGKVTKEERSSIKFINDRIISRLEFHCGTREAKFVKGLVFNGRKLLHKKEGEVLATQGQLCAPFMLVKGTIRIYDSNIQYDSSRSRQGIFGTECFFGLQSFSNITAETVCTIYQLNSKCHTLHLRADLFEKFIRYVPMFPISIHNPNLKQLLNIEVINEKYGKYWWKRSIAASILDRTVELSSSDPQFDVTKRPDFRDDILEIMAYYGEVPNYISVPRHSDPIIIQRVHEIPVCCWLLISGSASAEGEDDYTEDDEDPCDNLITDSDYVAILEINVCIQRPASATYSIQPGSTAVSIGRKTMLAVQFMKAYAMDAADAVKAVNESRIFQMSCGERIEEDKWFKGIIFFGKLNLVAIPPGRASEFEKYRRTVIDQRGSTVSRKSCRIATSLEYGFERCGPFDEFVAVQTTVGIITTGVESQDNMYTVEDHKLSTIEETADD